MAKLFAKFGEFDSAEEINRAATAQMKEGDLEAVRMIAKENGIDDMCAEDFISGDWPELCSPFMAAIGKLDVETAELDLPTSLQLWVDFIRNMAKDDLDLIKGIRRKGKNLIDLLAKLIIETSKTRKNVPAAITEAARKIDTSIPSTLPIGDISRKRLAEIIREYYIDPQAAGEEKAEVAPVQQEEATVEGEEPEPETKGGEDE